MANLTPVDSFDDVIQLETTDVAIGGAGGIMNAQAQALLNRTAYLKGVYDALAAAKADLSALSGYATTASLSGYATTAQAKTEYLTIACSDESTAITTGTAKITFRMPYAMTLTSVRANVNTASSSGVVTIDINENGSSILGTKLTIDANEKTSTTASSSATISDSNLSDDAEITVDFDDAGTGAKGVKITLIGTRV